MRATGLSTDSIWDVNSLESNVVYTVHYLSNATVVAIATLVNGTCFDFLQSVARERLKAEMNGQNSSKVFRMRE